MLSRLRLLPALRIKPSLASCHSEKSEPMSPSRYEEVIRNLTLREDEKSNKIFREAVELAIRANEKAKVRLLGWTS